jgi:hypothetical protein
MIGASSARIVDDGEVTQSATAFCKNSQKIGGGVNLLHGTGPHQLHARGVLDTLNPVGEDEELRQGISDIGASTGDDNLDSGSMTSFSLKMSDLHTGRERELHSDPNDFFSQKRDASIG